MADSFESLVGKQIILSALEEDIGSGDLTTLATVPEETELRGRLVARENGVIAGLTVALMVFQLLDDQIMMNNQVVDGQTVVPNQTLTYISGPGRAILSGERTALNLLQRMSGIATITQSYVQAVSGTQAEILDTRKTAPGLRFFDKMAVRLGGGSNHRFGLYDMALIKNNHITAVGGDLDVAVRRTREYISQNCQVEIEVRNLEELHSALELDVDRILLDNMTLHQLRDAVLMTNGKIPLEASGGVNLVNVREIALTGVDFISVGALTHSVNALDISLWID